MNRHMIIGNLTRDPETGTTDSGISWCRFSVAVNRRGKTPETDFIQVTAWRALGESCARYLSKGKKVCVIGESRSSAWTGRDGTAKSQIEITAQDVEFLSPGRQGPSDEEAPGGPRTDKETGMAVADPEDLPY